MIFYDTLDRKAKRPWFQSKEVWIISSMAVSFQLQEVLSSYFVDTVSIENPQDYDFVGLDCFYDSVGYFKGNDCLFDKHSILPLKISVNWGYSG